MVIAAAAIAKSAVAIPIEIGPARPSWRMAPRLILPRRRCQASGGRGARRFAPREFAEGEKLLGGPAANPECLWLGRRVVSLLWRDDLDTAFRHLDLYDRFGCPAGHIQATFRCLVRQGNFDPKATDTLNSRVHGCWVNPNAEPQGTAAVPSGTTNR